MYKQESRAIISIALIMAFRMLGLFMILPVFSVSATAIPGASAKLIGVAIGAYGLTQACLQIPFGSLSDRIGRKPVVVMGLVLFIIGSIIAAVSHNIYGLIVGRAIQGGGAIGSAAMALLADLTRDEGRTKAMAMVGMSIGCAFSIALVLGTIINHTFGLTGIFWATAAFGIVGVLLLFWAVPKEPKLVIQSSNASRWQLLKDPSLLRLDLGIFCSHAILTALFIAIPLILQHKLQLGSTGTIAMYLIVLVVAFVLMVPFIIVSEKKRKLKQAMIGSFVVMAVCSLGLSFSNAVWSVALFLCIFFTAFSLLEASFPSLVSKVSPIKNRGSAMGIYSSTQFFGIFIGGLLGGVLLSHYGIAAIFYFCTALAVLWAILAISMPEPPYLTTKVFSIKQAISAKMEQEIKAIPGVTDLLCSPEEQLLICKIDKKIISENELQKQIKSITLGEVD